MTIDLHRHLEGSIRPSTALSFAAANVADSAQWHARVTASAREKDLLAYLAKIENSARAVRSLAGWHRVTTEAIADAYDDGLSAVELRFSPAFIADVTDLDPDAVIETVAGAATSNTLPIEVGLIGIVVRDQGPESAVAQMDRLIRHASRFVGVDLAGDEAGFPVADFAPAFRLAQQHDIPVTIHAGEAAGPESVWAAIRQLRPQRIGHGVRSAEDSRLLDQLRQDGVTLEVAITSNVQTGAAASLRAHPIQTLLAAEVPVALCTDNPTASGTRLSREFDIARSLVGDGGLAALHRAASAGRFIR